MTVTVETAACTPVSQLADAQATVASPAGAAVSLPVSLPMLPGPIWVSTAWTATDPVAGTLSL